MTQPDHQLAFRYLPMLLMLFSVYSWKLKRLTLKWMLMSWLPSQVKKAEPASIYTFYRGIMRNHLKEYWDTLTNCHVHAGPCMCSHTRTFPTLICREHMSRYLPHFRRVELCQAGPMDQRKRFCRQRAVRSKFLDTRCQTMFQSL